MMQEKKRLVREILYLRRTLGTLKYLFRQTKFNNQMDIIMIENKLDENNCENGTINCYCLYCKSIKYDCKIGIIHTKDCIILDLRKKIKKYNENETKIK